MGQTANYERGHDVGRHWISTTATPKQRDGVKRLTQLLPRVRKIIDGLADVHDGQNFDLATGEITAGDLLAFGDAFARAMLNVEGLTTEPASFWQTAGGDGGTETDAKFVHGFINGAIRAVK